MLPPPMSSQILETTITLSMIVGAARPEAVVLDLVMNRVPVLFEIARMCESPGAKRARRSWDILTVSCRQMRFICQHCARLLLQITSKIEFNFNDDDTFEARDVFVVKKLLFGFETRPKFLVNGSDDLRSSQALDPVHRQYWVLGSFSHGLFRNY